MSEYQYYEFQAIDRPLTEREMGDALLLIARHHHAHPVRKPLRVGELQG